MTSFASLAVDHRLGDHSKLSKLAKLIDWDRFNKYLSKIHKSDINPANGGRESYDKISMLKLILLGQWNSMSDPELEYAIRIRLDFISFCGFDINGDIPDHSTICRFRNKLIEKGLLERLLGEVNDQLVGLGLKVEKTNLAILDATIIESNSRPKNKILEEEIPEDRKEDESNINHFKEIKSSDPDATWLKKGSKSHFGYKSFATTDEEGFIDKTMTVPANESEINKLEDMIIDADKFSGDKGYDSKGNREALRNKRIKTRIMYRKPKNKPMTIWQKRFNKAVSKKRFRVEQTFGTLKRKFKFTKASYFTTKKVQAQFTMKAICLNLLKAVNKVTLIPPPGLQTG
jgi:transposase, IS5 family